MKVTIQITEQEIKDLKLMRMNGEIVLDGVRNTSDKLIGVVDVGKWLKGMNKIFS